MHLPLYGNNFTSMKSKNSSSSIQWDLLNDAYGPSSNIPHLLDSIDKLPRDDIWFELWSRLCHQGSVYNASYAAVPIIVSKIPIDAQPIKIDFFLLPICIEIARNMTDAPSIPKDISSEYFQSIEKMIELSNRYDSTENDPVRKRIFAAARMIGNKDFNNANSLLEE